MARYINASCRICRRETQKLFLKGDKCYSEKCAMNRKNRLPGQHTQSRKKLSEYGIQHREKQKAKRFYGILERQFEKYFVMANKQNGVTGENLLIILESRLDNVLYRSGFFSSRQTARQMICHGHILVNDKKLDIPSYIVKVNDVISINNKFKNIDLLNANIKKNISIMKTDWFELDQNNRKIKIVNTPNRNNISIPIEEHLIVEFYSK